MPVDAVRTRRVLVVDDHADVLEAMRLLLKGAGYSSDLAGSPPAALALALESDYGAILLDMNYARHTTSGEEGLALLNRLHAARPHTPVIVMTAWSTIELAVAAMQRGARDFIAKPWQNGRVLQLLEKYFTPEHASHDPIASARRVQERLLPPARFRSAAVECSFVWRPAGEIGGDYCDLFAINDDAFAFGLGDVSGKGIPAALLMTSVHATIRSHAELARRPGEIARAVNRVLCESTSLENYATLFFGVYERNSRRLRWVNCGHTEGILCRADGTVLRLTSTGTVVGIFENAGFEESIVAVDPGDRLVLFSDGLPDSQPDGGDEWIARSVSMLAGASSTSIAESLAAAAVNGAGELDDVTILDIRFL